MSEPTTQPLTRYEALQVYDYHLIHVHGCEAFYEYRQ